MLWGAPHLGGCFLCSVCAARYQLAAHRHRRSGDRRALPRDRHRHTKIRAARRDRHPHAHRESCSGYPSRENRIPRDYLDVGLRQLYKLRHRYFPGGGRSEHDFPSRTALLLESQKLVALHHVVAVFRDQPKQTEPFQAWLDVLFHSRSPGEGPVLVDLFGHDPSMDRPQPPRHQAERLQSGNWVASAMPYGSPSGIGKPLKDWELSLVPWPPPPKRHALWKHLPCRGSPFPRLFYLYASPLFGTRSPRLCTCYIRASQRNSKDMKLCF